MELAFELRMIIPSGGVSQPLWRLREGEALPALLWVENASKKLQGRIKEIEGHSETVKYCWIICHSVARCCKCVDLKDG